MTISILSILLGFSLYFILRCLLSGIYILNPNERAVITSFGKAHRIAGGAGTLGSLNSQESINLTEEEQLRYNYPQVEVIKPGIHFKFPWQKVNKVSISTEALSIAFDPEDPKVNRGGSALEAVTKDHLNTLLKGQIRLAVDERNLYAYLFGVKNPLTHVMGYFVSILREKIAAFSSDKDSGSHVSGISINDLRKNLNEINSVMEQECRSAVGRYGLGLDAVLITEIDPPVEVESALAAINTAHNQVSSEISLAQAAADQKIVQSRKAVEIETLKAEAEIQLISKLSEQLKMLKDVDVNALKLYVRNQRLKMLSAAKKIFVEAL